MEVPTPLLLLFVAVLFNTADDDMVDVVADDDKDDKIASFGVGMDAKCKQAN